MLAMWLNDWNHVLSGLCQSNIYMSALTCAHKRHVSGPYVPKRNSTKVSDWMTSLSYSLTIRRGCKKEHKVCSWVIENQGTTNKTVLQRKWKCKLSTDLFTVNLAMGSEFTTFNSLNFVSSQSFSYLIKRF